MSASAYETAIHGVIVQASGLSAQNVFWASQTADVNKPAGQHTTLQFISEIGVGLNSENILTYDENQPNGQEIGHAHVVIRELVLSLQVIGGTTVGDGSARDIATKIQRRLKLPTVREPLSAVGLSLFDYGVVQSLPAILDADFEARAVFELRFYLREIETERTGYIASAEIENEVNGDVIIVPN